ncbi:glycerophosphodiester phosphodiesterase family protein [Streptomyces katsurahamanus]|uniref:glycerophosphodiester phosphodiesterase n=1 Tax=Streptomyces katsurahamanus TaxID=2577098 RepID=A0ABW9NU17_9ACTN|nr:glycerophosphodiester phosphodiesterase family protein [Streptomyces katsurahamanus]MQS36559.1 glycerophosphodiester phosphodiesterase [Streptomyces katsurahamanus]
MPALPRRRSVLLAAGASGALAALPGTARAGDHGDHGDGRRPVVIGHRGAAGWRPEHTEGSYAFAVRSGADWIEPDLVPTKDHVLVVRHENEISQTTDVSSRPEFADRRARKQIDGRWVEGWFTEDFTLAELKTLRTVERLPLVRNRNTVFNGREPILTFQETVDLARRLSRLHGRRIAVFPETKHPAYFRSIGLPLEPELIRVIRRNRLDRHSCVVQSFEPASLLRMAEAGLRLPLWQAIGTTGGPFGHDLTYQQMTTEAGLARIAEYAEWIGPDKSWVAPPSPLLADAHAAGLKVGAYTFRAENTYLPAAFRRGTAAHDFGDAFGEYALHYGIGVDAVVTDFPDIAVLARQEHGLSTA